MKTFALVDCNNFYVSCERLFRPELQNRPVVVLSNNDGCIIARSNEAKALGFAMGSPYFKNLALLRRHKVSVFSSNYALYGDLSSRVMSLLLHQENEVEIYSIDEAFLALPASPNWDVTAYARDLCKKIKQWVGIPVSIGLAPTKTLAKIASTIAKKQPAQQGVCRLHDQQKIDNTLAQTPASAIWGIGRRSTKKLQQHGIHTALQLKEADQDWIRKTLTITGLRTVIELGGMPCLDMEKAPPPRKSIVSSRSFRRPITTHQHLKEAIATYTAIAAVKLRHQKLRCGAIHVFLTTNRFQKEKGFYANSQTITLASPSGDTPRLTHYALQGLQAIFKKGYRYSKAGIMLLNLSKEGHRQLHLFRGEKKERRELMVAMDKINQQWGRHTLQVAASGLNKSWSMSQEYKSPAYTTNWQELPHTGGGK